MPKKDPPGINRMRQIATKLNQALANPKYHLTEEDILQAREELEQELITGLDKKVKLKLVQKILDKMTEQETIN